MNKKIKVRETIGEMQYNEQYGFFHGFVNGCKVTMNQVEDKEGKKKWLMSKESLLYVVQDKQNNDGEF